MEKYYNSNFAFILQKAMLICKYEFLMSRILVLITLVTTALNAILFLCSLEEGNLYYKVGHISVWLLIMILFFSHFIFAVAYFLSAAISFYQGVFGRNAYLTHSLPIPLDSILLSKILVFFLWALVGIAEFLFTIFVLDHNSFNIIGRTDDISRVIHYLVVSALSMLLEIVYIFMVAAMVHKKKTYTMIYGIFVYFGIKVLAAILIINFLGFMETKIFFDGYFGIAFLGLLCIICYLVCREIVKNRLSI